MNESVATEELWSVSSLHDGELRCLSMFSLSLEQGSPHPRRGESRSLRSNTSEHAQDLPVLLRPGNQPRYGVGVASRMGVV